VSNYQFREESHDLESNKRLNHSIGEGLNVTKINDHSIGESLDVNIRRSMTIPSERALM